MGGRRHGVNRQVESLGNQQVERGNADAVTLLSLQHARGEQVVRIVQVLRGADSELVEDKMIQGLDAPRTRRRRIVGWEERGELLDHRSKRRHLPRLLGTRIKRLFNFHETVEQ